MPKVVIDMSDEEYNKVMSYKNSATRYEKAIQRGTVLPKHHGRLIDADALECETYLVSKGNGMYGEVKGYFNIDDASTILEETE